MNFGVLDLGTTNTVGGYTKGPDGSLVELWAHSINTRTALYAPHKWSEEDLVFWDDAIREFLNSRGKDRDEIGRLITSPKSCLGTHEELSTHFCGIDRSLTEILSLYISWVKKKFENVAGTELDSFVISHPVKFSENNEIHEKALRRLQVAANMAGIKNIIFEAEPIAAARKYASHLQHEETFLIADAGGGTTDFTIVKANPAWKFEVLASSGVYMGGDNFDGIVSDMLSPKLWSWWHFKDWTKTLNIPSTWYRRIREWHNINPFLSARDREQLRKINHWITNDETKLAFSRVIKILTEWMIHEWHEVCEGLKVNSSLGRKRRSEPIISHDAEDVVGWLPSEIGEEDLWGLYVHLSLSDIEARSKEWVHKILESLRECRANAGVKSIDRVVFTGWTCLIPFIRREINKETGNPENADVAPFSAVAEGLLVQVLMEK